VVGHHTEAFVGIDTSKLRNAVAVADRGRGGEVRYLGEFPATEAVIQKLGAKLAAKYRHLTFAMKQGRQDMVSTDCSRASATSA
jgi:transposase